MSEMKKTMAIASVKKEIMWLMEKQGLGHVVCCTDPIRDPEEESFVEFLSRPPPHEREPRPLFPPWVQVRYPPHISHVDFDLMRDPNFVDEASYGDIFTDPLMPNEATSA